ncbi:MAG: hypothetical protein KIT44_03020 [Opitutaceae bacterium]|nr:hypothetical protein [Opitutaceae bacterium]
MKKLVLGLGMLVLATSLVAQEFTATLTPEERREAGLDKLSPGELARLQALVERYKAGEVAVVKQEAEQKIAAAEVRAQAAETKAATAAPEQKGPGWFRALLTLQAAGKQAADDGDVELQVRLAGTLRSFDGRRSFTLEDGQVWRMIERDSYAGPTLQNPAVTIRPGVFGVFWLKVPEAGLRVKVEPVKLQ